MTCNDQTECPLSNGQYKALMHELKKKNQPAGWITKLITTLLSIIGVLLLGFGTYLTTTLTTVKSTQQKVVVDVAVVKALVEKHLDEDHKK